jgi:hypothetical protein
MERNDKTIWAPGEGKKLTVTGDPFTCKDVKTLPENEEKVVAIAEPHRIQIMPPLITEIAQKGQYVRFSLRLYHRHRFWQIDCC